MEMWLIILTLFTIILVLFSFVNTFIFFSKSENKGNIIVDTLPIDENKKYLPEVLPTTISFFKKTPHYFKNLFKEKDAKKKLNALPTEVVEEENLQNDLLLLKASLKKGNLEETKLSTIKGIGKRTIAFLHLNNIDTLGDLVNLAEIDQKIRENIILGLPGLKSETEQVKHDKFLYFIKQAQEMVDVILNKEK